MPKTTRVTQAQVAARAGVSRTVASFVLNNRTDQRVSPATAQRVRQAARDLGYSPNKIADILRTGHSGTIAFISDYVTTTAAAHAMVRGALEGARAADRLLFTVETQGDSTLEDQLITSLIDRSVDGFIYASMFSREVRLPARLRDENTLMLNCTDPTSTATSILPDDFTAGQKAARLISEHARADTVIFLGALGDDPQAIAEHDQLMPLALTRRVAGLTDVLSSQPQTRLLMAPVPLTHWEAPQGRQALTDVLSTGVHPTAVICANDALAFGAYQALNAAGLAVPQDVAVVSFDGTSLGQWLIPALTTFALPHDEMGRCAIHALTDTTQQPGHNILIEMPLVRGASI